jgi:peptidoglycan/xylan/chitin deacetylase (PgdA/CDA1 family)
VRFALKVDVDTRRGMDEGVPRLLDAFAAAGVRATFFVTMGPDNSGKAALRAFTRRGFVGKMVRTNALRMYGLRTALSGTLLPARPVGSGRPDLMRAVVAAGHEAGVHGWDHVLWHDRILGMTAADAAAQLRRAADAFGEAVGRPPDCASAPAWVLAPGVLAEEERLGLRFASDTRGRSPFRPRLDGRASPVPQVPTTLPTLDELLGLGGVTEGSFARAVVERAAAAGGDAVFTLHAEAEGMSFHACLRDLLARLRDSGAAPVPCGALLEGVDAASLPVRDVVLREVPGRAGLLSTAAEDPRAA